MFSSKFVLDVARCESWQSRENCEKYALVGSRSFKVIEFGTNQTGMYDFQLVTDSNFGSILHDFRVTAT